MKIRDMISMTVIKGVEERREDGESGEDEESENGNDDEDEDNSSLSFSNCKSKSI